MRLTLNKIQNGIPEAKNLIVLKHYKLRLYLGT